VVSGIANSCLSARKFRDKDTKKETTKAREGNNEKPVDNSPERVYV
jgi:hypothetical protein